MSASGKILLRLLFAVIGVALVAYLVGRIGFDAIATHLDGVGFGFAWMVLAYAAGTVVCALPWYWLLPRYARPRVRGAITSRFAAAGANAVLPFVSIGGEPTRLLWLTPPHRAVGLAGVVVDRLLFGVASVVFLLIGLVTALFLAALPTPYAVASAALALGALVAAAAGAWVAANYGIARRIHKLVRRFRGAQTAELARGALGDGVDERLVQLLKGRRDRLVGGATVHLFGRVLLGAELYVGLIVVGVPVSPAEGVVLASVPVVVGIVGSWIPSQIGVQEGAVAIVCGLLGIDPAAGVSVVVLQRIRQIGTVTLAWALISRRAGAASRRASPAAKPAPERSGERLEDEPSS